MKFHVYRVQDLLNILHLPSLGGKAKKKVQYLGFQNQSCHGRQMDTLLGIAQEFH